MPDIEKAKPEVVIMVDELEQDFVEEQVNLPRIETPTIA